MPEKVLVYSRFPKTQLQRLTFVMLALANSEEERARGDKAIVPGFERLHIRTTSSSTTRTAE